jgi:hypothetical protein
MQHPCHADARNRSRRRISALAIGSAWASGRKGVAKWLVIAILAGEAFGFLSTAERLIVGRVAMQAPLRVAQEAFDNARQRASDASSALAALSVTSHLRPGMAQAPSCEDGRGWMHLCRPMILWLGEAVGYS